MSETLRDAVLALDAPSQDHDGTMRRFCQLCGWHESQDDHEPDCVVRAALGGAGQQEAPEPRVVNPKTGITMPMREAWQWACVRVEFLEAVLRGDPAALEVWYATEGVVKGGDHTLSPEEKK